MGLLEADVFRSFPRPVEEHLIQAQVGFQLLFQFLQAEILAVELRHVLLHPAQLLGQVLLGAQCQQILFLFALPYLQQMLSKLGLYAVFAGDSRHHPGVLRPVAPGKFGYLLLRLGK